MSITKLKVGFDPTVTWDYELFRDIISDMVQDTAEVEVFIVTTNPDTEYINDVAVEAGGIENSNIFQVADNDAVVTTLSNNSILIYLTAENELVITVNNDIPLSLEVNNVTGCQAILVNSIIDRYKLQPKWVTMLQFWIGQIEKYTINATKNC